MQRKDVLTLCGNFSRATLLLFLSALVALFLTFTYLIAILMTLMYIPRAVLISKLNW